MQFSGEKGLRFPSYSPSHLNPEVIDSTPAWNPYAMIGANKLGDIGFFSEFNPGFEIKALPFEDELCLWPAG